MMHKLTESIVKPLLKEIELPVKVGDTVLMGRFKNKKVKVKSVKFNDRGDLMINDRPALKFRIPKSDKKLLPSKPTGKDSVSPDADMKGVKENGIVAGDGTIKGGSKLSKIKKMKKKGHSSVPYGSGYKKVKEASCAKKSNVETAAQYRKRCGPRPLGQIPKINESEIKIIHSLLQKFGNSPKDATNMIKKYYKKVQKKFKGQTSRDKAMALIGLSLLGEVSRKTQLKYGRLHRKRMELIRKYGGFGPQAGSYKLKLKILDLEKQMKQLKMNEAPRKPRKKGQHRQSSSHSDLYTDENPKGTIHGLKFATVKDATKSVSKIKSSGKSHAHKIQAAVAMEQRAREMGKSSQAAVYRKFINQMKKKTKQEESKMSLKLEELVGKPITEAQFDEAAGKKDACYHKVKARYDVWPSAYASGALVKCRKVGAANWGNKSKKEDVYYESITENGITETHVYWESDGKPHGYSFAFVNELNEAEYQGRKVKLGKIMQGDTKKFKVYVKNPKGNVVKVNFGQGGGAKGGTMRIRKSNPKARANFRARHNCDNPGPRHKARYWSCRKW